MSDIIINQTHSHLSMAVPLCNYFRKCNGCTSQHIDYETQLENKMKNVANATQFDEVKVFHDKEYFYRNKMEVLFSSGKIGFRSKENKLIEIEECVIANKKLNELLKEIRTYFKNTAGILSAVIRTPTNDSCINFILNKKSMNLKECVEKINDFSKKTAADNVIVSYAEKTENGIEIKETFSVKGTDFLREKHLGKEFVYSALGFFQNNRAVAEKMQKYVNELLKNYETKNAALLDLYAGVGTFGIINSALFKNTIIAENDRNCIEAANKNIVLNNAKNTSALALDAKKLKKVLLPKELFVIADPPRSGMDEDTIVQLQKLEPKVIIYISCNIQQLRKDLPKLKKYKIKSAAMFDMFPQTNHAEAVAELAKIL